MDKNACHKYEYEVDLNSDSAAARVVRMVGKGKRVLEIGAGPGSITRLLRDTGQCRVTALEIDSDAIKILTSFCERVYKADLNDTAWPMVLRDEGPFEVIVAADVLEHLYDPWSALKAMKKLLSDDGYIVISLPHAGHSALVACLLEEDFEYRDWGLLDRTHIRFFGMKNIQALFEGAGWKILDGQFVEVSPDRTEFAERWLRIPRPVRRALSTNRFGTVYQVVVKAVPKESRIQGISLLSLPVKSPVASSFRIPAALKSVARSILSDAARARLRRIANQLGISIFTT
jgi:2-polyprenyl-3-methyl-5-hydroxy-6-metoxy-1,4-benzoquinol methylase